MPFRAYNPQSATVYYFIMQLLPFCFKFLDCFRIWIHKFGEFRFIVAAKNNISSASGHVCCNRNVTRTTGLRYDIRFLFMKLCIQDLMIDIFFSEYIGKRFRYLD